MRACTGPCTPCLGWPPGEKRGETRRHGDVETRRHPYPPSPILYTLYTRVLSDCVNDRCRPNHIYWY
jgi:hypothetical protein